MNAEIIFKINLQRSYVAHLGMEHSTPDLHQMPCWLPHEAQLPRTADFIFTVIPLRLL